MADNGSCACCTAGRGATAAAAAAAAGATGFCSTASTGGGTITIIFISVSPPGEADTAALRDCGENAERVRRAGRVRPAATGPLDTAAGVLIGEVGLTWAEAL